MYMNSIPTKQDSRSTSPCTLHPRAYQQLTFLASLLGELCACTDSGVDGLLVLGNEGLDDSGVNEN